MVFDAHFMLDVNFWLSTARHFYILLWWQKRSKWNWVRLDCQSDGTARILSITPHSANIFSQFLMNNFSDYWICGQILCMPPQNFQQFLPSKSTGFSKWTLGGGYLKWITSFSASFRFATKTFLSIKLEFLQNLAKCIIGFSQLYLRPISSQQSNMRHLIRENKAVYTNYIFILLFL